MRRSHLLYLNDITEAIEKIQRYTKGLSYKKFHQSVTLKSHSKGHIGRD